MLLGLEWTAGFEDGNTDCMVTAPWTRGAGREGYHPAAPGPANFLSKGSGCPHFRLSCSSSTGLLQGKAVIDNMGRRSVAVFQSVYFRAETERHGAFTSKYSFSFLFLHLSFGNRKSILSLQTVQKQAVAQGGVWPGGVKCADPCF